MNDPSDDLVEVPITFSRQQLEQLKKIADSQDTTSVSDLVRQATDIFLDICNEDILANYPELQVSLQKMEHRLLRLLAKSIQINGQALYFASLPYMTGPPKARLNEEGLEYHWTASQNMAAKLITPKQKTHPES